MQFIDVRNRHIFPHIVPLLSSLGRNLLSENWKYTKSYRNQFLLCLQGHVRTKYMTYSYWKLKLMKVEACLIMLDLLCVYGYTQFEYTILSEKNFGFFDLFFLSFFLRRTFTLLWVWGFILPNLTTSKPALGLNSLL